jgi:hypothetical protein
MRKKKLGVGLTYAQFLFSLSFFIPRNGQKHSQAQPENGPQVRVNKWYSNGNRLGNCYYSD